MSRISGSIFYVPNLFPDAKAAQATPRRLEALADRQDIPLAVLEPRRLRAAAGRDAVDRLDPRHVVFLEDDAARLQLRDFGRDVVDRPERGARLRGASAR